MHRLWPVDAPAHRGGDPDADLEAFYAYPADLDKPWLRTNFVSSLDGAGTASGSSRGLSGPTDLRVLKLIRDLSDVVLVGLGTALAEDYRGLKRLPERTARRRALGLSDVPPLALVTNLCSLPPESKVLSATVPTIVLTSGAAPADRRAELARAGADVAVVGDEQVDLRAALAELAARGLRRIVCEGGPTLFGSLVREDLVDELCLTVSPVLTGGSAGRIAVGGHDERLRRMRLSSVLLAEESALLLRYQRQTQQAE